MRQTPPLKMHGHTVGGSSRRVTERLEPRGVRQSLFPAFQLGALLLEQNDDWAVQRARYMTLASVGQLSDDPLISLPALAR